MSIASNPWVSGRFPSALSGWSGAIRLAVLALSLAWLGDKVAAQTMPESMSESARAASSEVDSASQPRPAKKMAESASEPAEPRGRLPRYFSSLVDEQQRQEIYRLQAEFRIQVEELERQLFALKEAETQAVESVLSQTQLTKLAELRAAARIRYTQSTEETTSPSPQVAETP